MIWAPQNNRERAVRAALVVAALCVSWVIAQWAAHRLIASMYRNTSWNRLNALLQNREQHSLTYYTAKADRIVVGVHVILTLAAALFLAFEVRSVWLSLGILLVGDIVLGVLSERYGGAFSIRVDWGFPEVFQYIKEIFVSGLFVRIFLLSRQAIYVGFALLFAFLFLDDSLKYHEQVGAWLAGTIDLSVMADPIGVRMEDIGEILSTLVPVGVFGALLAWGYWQAPETVRRTGRWVIAGVGCLGFFGVVIDLVDRLPALLEIRRTVAFIEDFGEMLIMSGIVAFSSSVVWRLLGRSEDWGSARRL